jgi:hypothetical protein
MSLEMEYKGSSSGGPHREPTRGSQTIEAQLVMEQNRMKQQSNQHCSEREFEVGDWVFLRIQPYKHMSLKQQNKDTKLAPKYYGPYKVFQRIRSMAYQLELPPSSLVHSV